MFARKTPHEQYEDKINSAGLNETELGRRWLVAAAKSIASPLSVTIPYSETGYFPADEPRAVGITFKARHGEKLTIKAIRKPSINFAVYLDLWEPPANAGATPTLLVAADTSLSTLSYEATRNGTYILRLQPELLKGGEYTLTVTSGPSLAFPVPPKAKPHIESFWGDRRDEGARKHEGIDIFAAHRTPLVAAADGVITQVGDNPLGGKVVFLSPTSRQYTLYYAHLDEQLAHNGQRVQTGDTIGLMGHSGNAAGGPSHLHFGVYTYNGPVDPFPFVNTTSKPVEKITAPLSNINQLARNTKALQLLQPISSQTVPSLESNTFLKVEAATASQYKVSLADGTEGYIQAANVAPLSSPVKQVRVRMQQPIYDAPDEQAARKSVVSAGERVSILAAYQSFYFVDSNNTTGWMLKKALQQ